MEFVAILMGSKSDYAVMEECINVLKKFDVPYEVIISSAHRSPNRTKEYVKNADLVIFACNSDAAGTRQEFSEMKQLYDADKPILLLLTQSDTYESDIDDEGEEISILVPKSEKDRSDGELSL